MAVFKAVLFCCLAIAICGLSLAVATTADCPTLRTLFEEAYQSGKRDYSSPYGWLEYNGYGVYIPQCLQNGSFATVQCSNVSLPINTTTYPYYYSSSRSRYCWCVDPATGIATTNVYRYDTVPSPAECPYFNTTTLCQDGKDRYFEVPSCISRTCKPGVPDPEFYIDCFFQELDCGPYVTAVYDECGCVGHCPPVAGLTPAQYIPLSVGLTALVIVLAIIGAGLGAICCVRKCWLCKKTVKVYPKITHYAPLTVDEKKLVDTTPHETMLH